MQTTEKRPTCASCFKEIKGAAYKIKGQPKWQCEECYLDDEPIEEWTYPQVTT